MSNQWAPDNYATETVDIDDLEQHVEYKLSMK